MPTAVTWNGTAYSIPNAGELNWATLTNFLVDLGDNAQTTNFQKLNARIATSTPVTVVAATDCIVNINIASAATVNLPAGSTGQVFYINDISGSASSNPITIDGNGAETINGSATYVFSRNNGGVMIAWNGTEWRIISESFGGDAFNVDKATVFNEAGADVDFRIEGDTDANLFFVDASTDRAAVGTTTPGAKFDVRVANGSTDGIVITSADTGGDNQVLEFRRNNAVGGGQINLNNGAGTTLGQLNGNTDSYLTGGNFGIGTAGPNGLSRVTHIHNTGAADSGLHLTNSDTGSTSGDGSLMYVAGSTKALTINQQEADGIIRFFHSGTEVAYFDTDSNNNDFIINQDVGIGGTSPAAKVHITNASGNTVPVLELDQDYLTGVFVNYDGADNSTGIRPVATNSGTAATKDGAIKVQINGTVKWIRFYDSHD